MYKRFWIVACALLAACSKPAPEPKKAAAEPEKPVFQVDAATAGAIKGTIKFSGAKPTLKPIDMSEDPACVAAHKGKPFEDTVVVNKNGTLSNVFVYIKGGLEGKRFAVPSTPAKIDQNGCWFVPRVLGIQTGQTLEVTNSDPVTHNIHPLAQINREWNHSQGEGDKPLARRFTTPEIMIRVKCNIHSWMRAYIGVVDNPYFAVTGDTGTFEIKNVPPGEYTLAVWQETLGSQEQKITVPASGTATTDFLYKGK